MKKILVLIFALLIACNNNDSVHNNIVPLPSGYGINSINDAFVPVSFSIKDFNWENGTLDMALYSEDLYDMVDISKMSTGDTILYMGNKIIIKSISREDDLIEINGGLGEENGAWIQAYEGGTWRGIQFDDHSVYSFIGKITLPLAKDFTIIDHGIEYTDPYDTIKVDQKQYLEGPAGQSEFCNLNTKVLVENGIITSIVRRWIP